MPGADAPPEWIVSRVCEEFALDPIRAIWVMEHAPLGLIDSIIELRAYAGTWRAIHDAAGDEKRQSALYATPIGQQVLEIESDFARAEKAGRAFGES